MNNTTSTVHPFTVVGLGAAPFRYIGMVDQGPEKDGMVKNGEINGVEFWTTPGGTCAYCGSGIKNMFRVRSADGKEFHVGCDCIEKVDGEMAKTARREIREHKRAIAVRGKLQAEREANGGLTLKEIGDARKAAEREAQVAKYAAEEQRRADVKAGSVYVGTVGQKLETTVKVERTVVYESQCGFQRIYLLRDQDGNRIVYKTSARLGVNEGDTIGIKGTIKAHSEYDGEKQTIIQRAKTL